MDLQDFYAMGYTFTRGALTAQYVGDDFGDDFRILRGEDRPPVSLVFRQKHGTRLKDFVGTTLTIPTLISPTVVRLFTEHRFTGWKTYSAEIRLKSGVVHRDHSLLVVTGKCGPIDDSKAPIKRRRPIVQGGSSFRVRVGLHFDPKTWDGSDLFVPQDSGCVVVTKAVRDCLIDAKVTNVALDNCAEIEELVF